MGNIDSIPGISIQDKPIASFGKLREVSPGKDSTTGHWELGGIHVDLEFSYFPKGFPKSITDAFLKKTGLQGFLGNIPASGTEIIKELGEEHQKTGYPIIYTSADSVFQIAAHEETIPLDDLYKICEITRHEVLIDPWTVGRVIARPFIGKPGNYTRTTNRKDFSLDPPSDTILDVLKNAGIETIAIGKINDLFNYKGIVTGIKSKSNDEGCNQIIKTASNRKNALIFTNLVDFDVYYGHRLDPDGFAKALKEFDNRLPEILKVLSEDDALILTADHGNDPTVKSTDHTREYVPLLFYQKGKKGRDIGTRSSFSDVAKTVGEYFGVTNTLKGKSFLNK